MRAGYGNNVQERAKYLEGFEFEVLHSKTIPCKFQILFQSVFKWIGHNLKHFYIDQSKLFLFVKQISQISGMFE